TSRPRRLSVPTQRPLRLHRRRTGRRHAHVCRARAELSFPVIAKSAKDAKIAKRKAKQDFTTETQRHGGAVVVRARLRASVPPWLVYLSFLALLASLAAPFSRAAHPAT